MDKILFIDGMNAIWRSCIKFGSSQQDVPDEVIFTFNFFRNLRPIIQDLSPDKCFFVLEGHPKFRYELYSDYKANRIFKQASDKSKKISESFVKAKDIILDLLKYFPFTFCRAIDYEADDVISSLVANMSEEDLTILSSDSDYIQLLQKGYKKIRIYNPIKKMDMEAPNYPYVAWKCLNGDKSDNIRGLLKPKKALDTVLDTTLFSKFLSSQENASNFNINRKLIEFASVPLDEIEMYDGTANFEALYKAFLDFKFESMTNDLSWKKYCNTFNCFKF